MRASFDVTLLDTNVPLTFTIDYILDRMYPTCSGSCQKGTRTEQCSECKNRNDFQIVL
jgi:DnaJ-class molecular chaperone